MAIQLAEFTMRGQLASMPMIDKHNKAAYSPFVLGLVTLVIKAGYLADRQTEGENRMMGLALDENRTKAEEFRNNPLKKGDAMAKQRAFGDGLRGRDGRAAPVLPARRGLPKYGHPSPGAA